MHFLSVGRLRFFFLGRTYFTRIIWTSRQTINIAMDSTTAMNNIKVILLQKYLARRLSSERERFDQFWWMTLPTLAKKLCYSRLPPNLAHRKLIDLANYVPSSSSRGVLSFSKRFFSNLVKMALPSGRILSRLLRRMKAFIDEFRPNTSQANYFGGFWRITSEINAKIEVRKQ